MALKRAKDCLQVNLLNFGPTVQTSHDFGKLGKIHLGEGSKEQTRDPEFDFVI